MVNIPKGISVTAVDLEDAYNGLTNQDSGYMAFRDMCKKENINSKLARIYVEDELGWLHNNEITVAALVEWNRDTWDIATQSYQLLNSNILMEFIGNGLYINTNCDKYKQLISLLLDRGFIGEFNRNIKNKKPSYANWQVQAFKKAGYKVRL